ncbi:MAG TPA: 4-vinyl reductase [Desulfobacteraceae bacterium]|nr:4-vinyl reductase [Desulfobacteraceae bacterium]|tara:strand:- start:488 stop:1012 length:525 start_codon:yes stop_codon:yes gene_type:complete
MFKEERSESLFDWDMIGDVAQGRPNLGGAMDVSVYRLMQFTLRDVIIQEFDTQTADRIYFKAGKLAGTQFCRKLMDKTLEFQEFVRQAQDLLSTLKIGILRVEHSDMDKMEFTLTVAEDLDCSGLPVTNETICTYDEGFLAGLLEEYSGRPFAVKEVDCWCSGDRVCRFDVRPE